MGKYYAPWTKAEDGYLKTAYADGVYLDEIAANLPGRTRGAVRTTALLRAELGR